MNKIINFLTYEDVSGVFYSLVFSTKNIPQNTDILVALGP